MQRGLYQSKVTFSLAAIQRPGLLAHNCKMTYCGPREKVAQKFYFFLSQSFLALSQDENEMGRFLREQGSQDKSKAGKMMIAVGKAQSYSAQQRYNLCLI